MTPTPQADLWPDLAADLLHVLGSYRSRVSSLVVETKADRTLLTEADLAVEELIVTKIRALDPEARIIAEESGNDRGPASATDPPERVWVIDPIDGTAEFVRAERTEFCSVVCRLDAGVPTEALVVAPELGTGRTPLVLTASRSDGQVTVNGSPARLNAQAPSAQAASVTRSAGTQPRAFEAAMEEAGYALKVRTTSQTLDMVRTAVDISDVAGGSPRFDLFYRRRQKLWDGVAGLCFGECSGLVHSDLAGGKLTPVKNEILERDEPVFDETVLGIPEAVAWFRTMAQT